MSTEFLEEFLMINEKKFEGFCRSFSEKKEEPLDEFRISR